MVSNPSNAMTLGARNKKDFKMQLGEKLLLCRLI